MTSNAPSVPSAPPSAVVLPEVRSWVWPFLTDYQKEGLTFAVGRRNAHLHWACGAGKTLAAILWACAEPGPVVVVTRASARRQWAAEVKRFTTIEPYVILPESARRGNAETTMQYLDRCRRPFLIIGWDGLRNDLNFSLLSGQSVTTEGVTTTFTHPAFQRPSVVWDEAHMAKDHRRWNPDPQPDGSMAFTARTSVAARAGFLAPRAARRLALTATPVPDRTRDLWAQFDIVEPGVAGRFWVWAQKFCGAYQSEFGWITTGTSNLPELRAFMATRCHVVQSEVVYARLPPVRRITTYLSPADVYSRADKEATREIRAAAKALGKYEGGGTGLENTARAARLLEARLFKTAARKTKYVVQQVLDLLLGDQKVIVFTGRRRDVDGIYARLVKAIQKARPLKGSPVALWAADGETPAEERSEIVTEYMAHPGPCALIGTGASFGESVNLHDTDRLIIVLLPWTWGQIRQWEGRVRRLGMTRPCIIEYLVAEGTIDERIAGKVLDKLAAVETILPDEQVAGVREAVRGGTSDEIIDGLLDQVLDGTVGAKEAA